MLDITEKEIVMILSALCIAANEYKKLATEDDMPIGLKKQFINQENDIKNLIIKLENME
jgi:hypothetical protein